MNFKDLFPLINSEEKYSFESCLTMQDFISEVISIYFRENDERTKECCLSVYMAMRDHYPSYVKNIDQKIKDQIAILVTFSAHNDKYAKHSLNFEKTIRSLRVIATKDLLEPWPSLRIEVDVYDLSLRISDVVVKHPVDEREP